MKKDIEKLENIQHRATRLAPNLRKKGYEFRLTTLEIRRKRGDLIQFYKVQIGHDHIKWKNEPEINLVSGNLRRGVHVFVGNLRIYVHPGMSSF